MNDVCIWDRLAVRGRPVVLYGTGNGADKVIDELQRRGIPVAGVFASDGFVRRRVFRGFEVMSYSAAREKFGEMTVLMCFGSDRPEVLANAEKIARENELFAPDVPVYGDDIFDADFYAKNEKRLDFVRGRLADERSVFTFDCVVRFKLTGRTELLRACECLPENDGLPPLPEDAAFVDLGAYTGDTALAFADKHPAYTKIIAVEPDARNFRKLTENTALLRDFTAIRAAVSDTDGSVFVDRNRGKGSHESAAGEKIAAVTLDTLLKDTPGRVIVKADVEGNELKMLRGATKTLTEKKPFLILDCYHRSEDLFTLPEAVLSANPGYRVYMRHRPYVPAWETAYWFYPEE